MKIPKICDITISIDWIILIIGTILYIINHHSVGAFLIGFSFAYDAKEQFKRFKGKVPT